MTWVDSHCHLQLDDRGADVLLGRAPEVDWVVVPGVDAATSEAALALAVRYSGRVYATAGLHPHDAERWATEAEDIARLAASASAVGETGLDYYRDLAPRAVQRHAFRAQAELALELDKPLIVHCRDAFADVYEILDATGAGPLAVMHCWTGGPRWTRRFLELEVVFSFAGPVAFPTGDTVRRGAAIVPPDRAMVETDTPYLAPPPHRGEPNEPAWVSFNGHALAEVWGMADEEVAEATSTRAAAVFRR